MSGCVEFGLNSGLHFRGTLSIDPKKQKANIGIDMFLPSKAQKEQTTQLFRYTRADPLIVRAYYPSFNRPYRALKIDLLILPFLRLCITHFIYSRSSNPFETVWSFWCFTRANVTFLDIRFNYYKIVTKVKPVSLFFGDCLKKRVLQGYFLVLFDKCSLIDLSTTE